MKLLEVVFSKKGFNFTRLWRDEKFALYRLDNTDTKDFFYEFIRIRRAVEAEFHGIILPEQENYPTDKSWGGHGWTYRKLDNKAFLHIVNKFPYLLLSDLSSAMQEEELKSNTFHEKPSILV